MFAQNKAVVQLRDEDLVLEFVSNDPQSFAAEEAIQPV